MSDFFQNRGIFDNKLVSKLKQDDWLMTDNNPLQYQPEDTGVIKNQHVALRKSFKHCTASQTWEKNKTA